MTGALRRWIAFLLLASVAPGAAEMVENLGHLVVRGHLAHASESGDEHSEPDTEHGCNGAFHVCSCHMSLSFITLAPTTIGELSAPHSLRTSLNADSPRAGFHQIPEKPPRDRRCYA